MARLSWVVTSLDDERAMRGVIKTHMTRKWLERVMGFEPTTFCLGSRHSTPELHPLARSSRSPSKILATDTAVGNCPVRVY